MNAAFQCLAAVTAISDIMDSAVISPLSGNLVAAFHEHLYMFLGGSYISLAPTCLKVLAGVKVACLYVNYQACVISFRCSPRVGTLGQKTHKI